VIPTDLWLADAKLEDEMRTREIPGWDSFRHLKIMAAVGREFGIHLKSLEVMLLKDIGEALSLVDRKPATK